MHRYDKQKIYTYISTLTASTPQPLVVEFVSSCQNQYILYVNDLIECKLKRGGGGWVIHFWGGGVWVGRRGNLKSIIYNSCSPRFISTNFILLVSLVYWKPASIYLSITRLLLLFNRLHWLYKIFLHVHNVFTPPEEIFLRLERLTHTSMHAFYRRCMSLHFLSYTIGTALGIY